MQIERRSNLSEATFLTEYLAGNRPVIVTDAMAGWRALAKWNAEFLTRKFGQHRTQIYDNLFNLVDVAPLADYMTDAFSKQASKNAVKYVRWYTKLRELGPDLDDIWADAIFEQLKDDWDHPYFLPTTMFAIPFCRPPASISANEASFPYKGLFLSGAGGRTRLHRDPFGTAAILCQISGRKRITFYGPQNDQFVRQGDDFLDPKEPAHLRFPNYRQAHADYDDILEPGETLFIPDNWFHDVLALSRSISITWNFVHSSRLDPFRQALLNSLSDGDLKVIQYFLPRDLGVAPTAEKILHYFAEN